MASSNQSTSGQSTTPYTITHTVMSQANLQEPEYVIFREEIVHIGQRSRGEEHSSNMRTSSSAPTIITKEEFNEMLFRQPRRRPSPVPTNTRSPPPRRTHSPPFLNIGSQSPLSAIPVASISTPSRTVDAIWAVRTPQDAASSSSSGHSTQQGSHKLPPPPPLRTGLDFLATHANSRIANLQVSTPSRRQHATHPMPLTPAPSTAPLAERTSRAVHPQASRSGNSLSLGRGSASTHLRSDSATSSGSTSGASRSTKRSDLSRRRRPPAFSKFAVPVSDSERSLYSHHSASPPTLSLASLARPPVPSRSGSVHGSVHGSMSASPSMISPDSSLGLAGAWRCDPNRSESDNSIASGDSRRSVYLTPRLGSFADEREPVFQSPLLTGVLPQPLAQDSFRPGVDMPDVHADLTLRLQRLDTFGSASVPPSRQQTPELVLTSATIDEVSSLALPSPHDPPASPHLLSPYRVSGTSAAISYDDSTSEDHRSSSDDEEPVQDGVVEEEAVDATTVAFGDEEADELLARIPLPMLDSSAAGRAMMQPSSEMNSIVSSDTLYSVSLSTVPSGSGLGLQSASAPGVQQVQQRRQSTSQYVRGLSAIVWKTFSGAE